MIKIKTAVDTQGVIVWRRKIASIAAHIAKQSRPVPKFPVSADIRSVLGRLIETTNAFKKTAARIVKKRKKVIAPKNFLQ
jgi:hypothetical protein